MFLCCVVFSFLFFLFFTPVAGSLSIFVYVCVRQMRSCSIQVRFIVYA